MTSPSPAKRPLPSVQEFLSDAVRSQLISGERIADLKTAFQKTGSHESKKLADFLCQRGVLTRFQADKLLLGLWQGLVVGPFRILAPIGRGGMGVVYLAARGSERFALKILPPRMARDEPRKAVRFQREIRVGLALPPHPHVARAIDGGTLQGISFLAMEYVPGPTLRRFVMDLGCLPADRAVKLFAGLADGLAAIHAAGVIHRDLKPSNAIVTPSGNAKWLDFGFAMSIRETLPDDPRIAGGQGYILGTMDYIAPEQLERDGSITPASDVYSLGGTIFFALTGSPPYPGGDTQQKLRWHRTSEPPDVRTISPNVPAWLAEQVQRMLAKDPTARPTSAAIRNRFQREFPEPIILTINPGDEESNVQTLTNRHVPTEELLQPIILDEDEPRDPKSRPVAPVKTPPWFWPLIGLLSFTIILMLAIGLVLFLKSL